ncbi:MAG: hypothetical protein OEQ13_01500 [Acidobacteriota bacterium]|nr:hypothetical protein [Acidobacteriota bacterium]
MSDRSSVFLYLGLGCVTVLVLCAVCVAGAGFATYRTVKRITEDIEDPEKREDAVKRILGADELPPGYHPVVGMEIPFSVMKLAVLSDTPSGADGQPGGIHERGFIYVDMIMSAKDEKELRAYFEGETDDPSVLKNNRIDVNTDDVFERGVIETDEADLLYLVQRGDISAQRFGGHGLGSFTLVDCPEDRRLRLAVWIGPDPDPSRPVEELDLTGTPGDKQAIAAFLGRFSLCP